MSRIPAPSTGAVDGRAEVGAQRYDLFISHSRALDAKLAEALQRGVERFAKPWWRPRSLRAFRDVSSLSANPNLWSSIIDALARTRFLLLLASPQAAASPWVARELKWWLEHRSLDTLILGVTAGRVPWSEPEVAGCPASCVSSELVGCYGEPPRWVDLRALRAEEHISQQNPVLLDAVADIGAAVRGIDKDELVGEHIRQHRRVRRVAATAVTLLCLLTVATVVAAVLFAVQRNTAREQARIATARQFAATAEALGGQQLDLAMLLAARGYRLHPEPRTYAAAFAVATSSPKLAAFAYAKSPISAVTATGDGSLVVVGEEDGTVAAWRTTSQQWQAYGSLPHAIVAAAIDQDGGAAVATDGTEVALLWPGHQAQVVGRDPGKHITAVAFAPNGAVVAWGRTDLDAGVGTVTVRRLPGGAPHSASFPRVGFDRLVFSAGDLIGFDGGDGIWLKLAADDLKVIRQVRENFGTHIYAYALSDDGSAFTYTNSAPVVPVWDAAVATDQTAGSPGDGATRYGAGPGISPDAMALSPRGQYLALSDGGTMYVSSPVADRSSAKVIWTLPGLSGTGVRNVQWLGNGRLVTTGQRQLALWNLLQVSPLASWQAGYVPAGCNACAGPIPAVSPDGRRVAEVAATNPSAVIVHDFSTGKDRSYEAPEGQTIGPPVWSPDGRQLLVPLGQGAGVVKVLNSATLATAQTWPADGLSDDVVAARYLDGGTRFATARWTGRVTIRDVATGAVVRVTPAISTRDRGGQSERRMAAINGAGTRLVIAGQSSTGLRSVNLATGTTTQVGSASDFVLGVQYAGDRLLVSTVSDASRTSSVDIYGADGAKLQRHLTTGFGMLESAVGNAVGPLIAYQGLDGAVVLLDLASGERIGTIPMRASTEAIKTGLAFDRTGTKLITVTESENGTDPGYLQQWSVDPDAAVRTLCRLAGRSLTIDEWKALAPGRSPDLTCR